MNHVILNQLKDIIRDETGADLETITPSARFLEDLGLDSLDQVVCIMEIEARFDIDISDQDAERIITVQDAVNYIEKHAA